MKTFDRFAPAFVVALGLNLGIGQAHAAFDVQATTDTNLLAAALVSSGLTINSVDIINGVGGQFGTYSGLSGTTISMPNGVVLSTGRVADIPNTGGLTISSELGGWGTTEFDTYAAGHIVNFSSSHDVASLKISFNLATASAISFKFAFGSVEYPDYVNDYTDGFLVFLDGTSDANQIVFDSNNVPVQVGNSFASLLTTADTNTNFGATHGLLGPLTTSTGLLAAGAHTIIFELGDVNDEKLDSAIFLADFGLSSTSTTGPVTAPSVPEPGSYALVLAGMAAIGFVHCKLALKR